MHELTRGRRDCLTFGAMTAPLALLCPGASGLWAIPAAALLGALCALCGRAFGERGLAELLPVPASAAELLFLLLAEAKTVSLAADCWLVGETFPLFPLILLTLAAGGTLAGTDGAGRVSVVLTWALGAYLVLVLPAAAYGTSPMPEPGALTEAAPVAGVCLLGFCALFLPASGRDRQGALWAAFTVTAALTLLITKGKRGPVPILTAVQGMNRLGLPARFEALASCALTVSLYETAVLLGCAAGEILRALGRKRNRLYAFFLGAGALTLPVRAVPGSVFLAGSAIFWGLIPLLALPVAVRKNGQKKERKNEKRC